MADGTFFPSRYLSRSFEVVHKQLVSSIKTIIADFWDYLHWIIAGGLSSLLGYDDIKRNHKHPECRAGRFNDLPIIFIYKSCLIPLLHEYLCSIKYILCSIVKQKILFFIYTFSATYLRKIDHQLQGASSPLQHLSAFIFLFENLQDSLNST